ncbi:acyltransferase [Novosphingobium sp. KCTC 2891]|uniref:acyltransferase family protein n=1 Tax=Novosphingobium sp. KCTC 2891 TaxID=2989730 RepID=UPI0022218B41|nr:acyltransferase [Novosphingobium sp. KCTC 2891]MCW1381345.1 acyltransferase [Novosphingobium sp. KCTC 2891]
MTDLARLGRVLPGRLVWPVGSGAFRLFLALLVAVHHLTDFWFGKYAVYVFFVLSGFWVETMWQGRYALTRRPWLTFVVSRLWRLAPVMLLAGGLAMLALPAMGGTTADLNLDHPVHLALSSALLLGYAWLPFQPVPPAWSLDIEMQFYLAAPMMVLAVRSFPALWVLVGAGAVALGATVLGGPSTLPKYLVLFAAGMVAARTGWRPPGWMAVLSAVLFVVLVPLLGLSPWRGIYVVVDGVQGALFRWNLAYNLVLAASSIPFALYTVRQPSDAADRCMGDLSYIVYLLHWSAVQWVLLHVPSLVGRAVFGAAATAGVVVLSWAIWRWFDRPIDALRSRWVASRLLPAAKDAGVPEPAGP